jgi:hypothetical protein
MGLLVDAEALHGSSACFGLRREVLARFRQSGHKNVVSIANCGSWLQPRALVTESAIAEPALTIASSNA